MADPQPIRFVSGRVARNGRPAANKQAPAVTPAMSAAAAGKGSGPRARAGAGWFTSRPARASPCWSGSG